MLIRAQKHVMELMLNQMLHQGLYIYNGGDLQESDCFYRAIMQVQPEHPDVNHNLGLIAVSINKTGAHNIFATAFRNN